MRYDNPDDLLISLNATLRCGNKVVILNPGLTPTDIQTHLDDAETNLLITNTELEKKAKNWAKLNNVTNEILDTSVALRKSRDIKYRKWNYPDFNDVWGIIYSSGTTGRPKGIIRSHFSILSELLGWCIELELTKSSHFYIGRPVYYTGGLVLALSVILIGGTVTIYKNHTAEKFSEYIQNNHVDCSFLNPRQMKELIKYGMRNPIDYSYGKILTMGAPISADVKKSVHELTGAKIIESWGNTEGLGTITDPEDIDIRPGSIGRPFFTDDMFVLNESNEKCEPNVIGRIAGVIDSSFLGYNKRDDLNSKCVIGDIIISDDLGYQDLDGYFYLSGRASDRIVCDGVNIFPIDIEHKISNIPDIEEIAVIGVDSETHGEVPVAVVRVAPDFNQSSDLLTLFNSKLGKHQQLSAVKVVDEFKRTPSGKIKKEELKNLFGDLRI